MSVHFFIRPRVRLLKGILGHPNQEYGLKCIPNMNHLPILPILSFVYKFNNKGQNWKDREYLGGPSYLVLILEITQLRKFTWTLKSLLDRLIYHLVIFCAFPLNTHKFDCNSLTGVLL